MMSWSAHERHAPAEDTTESRPKRCNMKIISRRLIRAIVAPALVAKVLSLSNYLRVIDGKIVSLTIS
jgi:hypothetical protein